MQYSKCFMKAVLIPTRWRHGQDVIVQIPRLPVSSFVYGYDPDPVHGHGLQAFHCEHGAGDETCVAAFPLWALRWPDLNEIALGLVLHSLDDLGIGPGQSQGVVGGVCHLQVNDFTRWLWKIQVMCVLLSIAVILTVQWTELHVLLSIELHGMGSTEWSHVWR